MRIFQILIKRTFDIIISLLALIFLLPLFLVIAILIKLTSKGPVFFLQDRIGLHGKVFKIIKFRTMIVNAEYIGEGIRVSSEKDSRITTIGRLLRATSLDELPQLVNVLMGTMSLCGPRPPVTYVPYEGYDNYPNELKKRFEMRPGRTGLAQATVRNSATWAERIVIDIEYVQKFSLWLDIKIFVLTIKKVFKSDAIYGTSDQKAQEKVTDDTNEQKTSVR